MPERLLQLDDVRNTDTPDKVASLFNKLGYNATRLAQPLAVRDLELPARSSDVIEDSYLIADHQKGATNSLQVLLFQLHLNEWETPSTASNRMRAIAQSLCRRPSKFLLVGTQNYKQLMLVNPRTSLDAQMNVKTSIRKLLIDRTNPTAYDRDRLEAIAAHDLDPLTLYNKQCEAFDVEKLTKEFYKGYKEIFEQVQRVIRENNPHPYFDDASRLHQFSQRLLGRVMFLYFLQKKEFLGSDRDFLKNQYLKLKPEPEDTEFYTTLLEPLFFEMLNKERPNFESPWGKIPYLNGGLFDRDYGNDVTDTAGFQTPDQLVLPNSLFDPSGERGVLKFFNGYNFTVSENIQGDEDVAVDPEMLGKVFENMLAADERGQSGTFYTPRGIVHFMCVESLSRYLADESGIDLEVVKQLAEFDPELPDADLKKLLTKDQTKKLKQALESVKVCDPAVGSGAFPLGMMQVILSVRQAIAQRESGVAIQRGSLTMSKWKRDIIANNLYGVDIKPEAIEIAKLRMWLSMVVDIPTLDDVEPLPNLDYKLMAGNSLISTIAGEHLIPDPTTTQQGMLNVTPIQAAIQPLLDLQHQYFESHSDERKELSKQIREAEAKVFRAAIVDRRQYWQGKASKAQAQKQQMIEGKLRELDTIEIDVVRGLRSLDFFQWHLHFNDVFQQKGGFDIVIGNPPYLGQQGNKEIFQKIKTSELGRKYHQRRMDLFYFFFHLSLDLSKDGGLVTFITTNYYLTATYADTLRKDLRRRASILKLVNFNELKVFESALGQHNLITCLEKGYSTDKICDSVVVHKRGIATFEILNSIFTGSDKESRCFSTAQQYLYEGKEFYIRPSGVGDEQSNDSTQNLLEKIQKDTANLGDICNIFQGLVTGAHKVSNSHLEKYQLRDIQEGEGIYVLTLDEIAEKGFSPTEMSLLKPWFKNSDISRWYTTKEPSEKVIYLSTKKRYENIPSIENHLNRYKNVLVNRNIRAGKISLEEYDWYVKGLVDISYVMNASAMKSGNYYCLSYPRVEEDFNSPKIVSPQRSRINTFGYNEAPWYASTDVYFITAFPKASVVNLKYVLAVLNSKLYYFWFQQKIQRKGEMLEFFKTPLSITPIKVPSTHVQNSFVKIVDKILSLNELNNSEVKGCEQQIDELIYSLYGLTPEEIKIIEGGQN